MMERSAAPKVVVLDRDGTIVVDKHYLADPDGLELLPGAAAGLQRFSALGHRLVVITNQSGVGRGLFSLQRMQEVNDRLSAMLKAVGVKIDEIYYCPHTPEFGCDCRKPRTGLIRRAALELGFDPAHAVVIGDQPSDVAMGRGVGATTVLIAQSLDAGVNATDADYVARDLLDAAEQLQARGSGLIRSRVSQ